MIDRILELLDVHGDCPSVVNARGEVEATLDKNAYDVLAKTTLLQHTLHVAEELLKLIPRGPMTPKAIITALGHDLGKIPIYREGVRSGKFKDWKNQKDCRGNAKISRWPSFCFLRVTKG